MRRFDQDGRLHIEWTNISKATVNPYYGREIPRSRELGLDPNRIYYLLRDPAELSAAAPTFNNIQLLSVHRAINANDPQEKLVAGSTGTDAEFRDPYLGNSLVVWRAEDIRDIESRDKCELSCAYYYDADMTPGEYQGLRYDGVMRNIRGNHVALVPAGRAGPDVLVADSGEILMPQTALASRKALMVKGALAAYLRPKLTAGPMIAMDAMLADVSRDTWPKFKDRLLQQVTDAARPRLAQDAKLDDLPEFLGALDAEEDGEKDEIEEEDEEERKKREAADKKAARDAKRAKDTKKAKDADPDDDDEDKKRDKEAEDKAAMDAAIAAAVGAATTKVRAETEAAVIARLQAVAQAREDVRPHIGAVPLAMDSAAAIYKLALDHHKVDLAGVPTEAYRAVLGTIAKPGAARPLAMDAAPAPGIEKRQPGVARILMAR